MICVNSSFNFNNFLSDLIITLLLILLLGYSNSYAQSELSLQFDFAKRLYTEERYYDAITELKRLQFFDSLNQFSFISNKLIGEAYKQGGKMNEALFYFSKAELLSPNIDSLFDIKVEIIKINLLRRTTIQAFELLDSLKEDPRFLKKSEKITYWKGWAYIFIDDWGKAAKEFESLPDKDELAMLCRNVDDSKYSVGAAKILSYILPGAGQIYAGKHFSGLLSLSWVTLWTYLSVEAFIAERVFDGLLISNFLAFRFYNGSLQNAEKFVNDKNLEISSYMLNYLQKNYRGEKP